MPTSHDQNFKNLILDYPRESLAFFAGDEAPAEGDNVTIMPVRQEQLKQRLNDHFRELDVPLLVEWPDGRREALLFVLEEETDPRRFSLHRLAHYCLDLAELCNTDRVVPVVIFLHANVAVARMLKLGSERRDYLRFDYLACNLAAMRFEEWQHSDNLAARLNLVNMHWSPDDKVHAYAQAIRGLFELESNRDKQAKYIDFIDIYAELTDNELRRWQQEYPEENTAMAGFVQRQSEQARQEGVLDGIHQGERAVLERQLLRRFGQLPADLTEKLETATIAELEAWADKVLDARSLEEIFD